MEVGAWDGTISRDDFFLAAQALVDKWPRVGSSSPPWSWSWVSPPKRPPFLSLPPQRHVAVDGYVSLEKMRPEVTIQDNVHMDVVNDDDDDDDDGVSDGREAKAVFCGAEEEIDTATLVQGDGCEVHHYDLHVVYSESFRVPVLYFRGYCSDGRLLLLDEIEKDLPACSKEESNQPKWTFITQEEHPYLNRPWYKLHPCGTGEWIKLLFLGANTQVPVEGYLVSWLSVVGQVIGLRIPIEMAIDTPVSVANGCP